MKHRKVTILARGIAGSDWVGSDEAAILFHPFDGLVVNEKTIRHHGFAIGVDDSDGFLELTIKNVEFEDWDNFMADEEIDDVLDGTGQQVMDEGGEVTALDWYYGANIVLPVHELEVKMLAPA